jgi:FAD/FMN-containing dehydrogenase
MQADILLELTWVDGSGKVHTSSRDSDAGRALVSGLGVAGVVTELLLQLQPPSHTALSTRFKRSDANLLNDVHEMLKVGKLCQLLTRLHLACAPSMLTCNTSM